MGWTWANIEHTCASIFFEDGSGTTCGVNLDPLASWLAEGNKPKPYETNAELLTGSA